MGGSERISSPNELHLGFWNFVLSGRKMLLHLGRTFITWDALSPSVQINFMVASAKSIHREREFRAASQTTQCAPTRMLK